MNIAYNMDCLAAMREMPDDAFDLCIADPPYGIGLFTMNYTKEHDRKYGVQAAQRRDYRHMSDWDVRPSQECFDEIRRVSKKQIIFGGNYFTDLLPPSTSWLVWDKRVTDNMRNDFSDCELAWMSKGLGVARIFRFQWNGMIQGDMKNKEDRWHPTQKPVALYRWILNQYLPNGGGGTRSVFRKWIKPYRSLRCRN